MPRISKIQNTLNGGEFSRSMYGRTDIKKYGASLKTLKNFVCRPQGGVQRRSGTKYVANVETDANESRLEPFAFSTSQAYVVEFADTRCRFFRNEAPVYVDAQTFADTGVNTTTDEITTTAPHHFVHSQGAFELTDGGGLPGGLAASTSYFIKLPQESTYANADITVADDLFTKATHGYKDEQGPFQLKTSGSLPDELDTNDEYFISFRDNVGGAIGDTAGTFTLSTTAGGNAVDLVTLGTDGTHTLYPTDIYKRATFQVALTAGGAAVDITTAGSAVTHTIDEATANTVPAECEVPFTGSEVQELRTAQSADVLFIAHGSHPPGKLQRTGHALWTYDLLDPQDGPYLDENTTAITMTPSAFAVGNDSAATRITITAAGGTPFLSTDVGRPISLDGGTTRGWAVIREVVSSIVVRVNIISAFESTTATTAWRLGAWGTATGTLAATGWPSAIGFFEQRLTYAGWEGGPNAMTSSNTGDFNNFAFSGTDGAIVESNALNYSLNASRVDAVRWLISSRAMVLGTTDGMWPMQATSFSDPITPTNIQAKPSSAIGTANIRPEVVEDVIFYATNSARRVLGLRYVFDSDSYSSSDFSLHADEVVEAGVAEIAYQQEPYSVLWFRLGDGKVAGFTYVREQEVTAWHRHQLGGSFSTGDAVVESMAVIPNPEGTADQLWLVVKRTVNSATVRHIEYMEDRFVRDTAESDLGLTEAHFVDAGIRDTSASTTISGLGHLEGETVSVLVDGAPVDDKVVNASGEITLSAAGTVVIAGLAYDSDIETLNLEVQDPQGNAQGHLKKIDHVTLRLMDTVGCQAGPDESNLRNVLFDAPLMDNPPTLFTGDKRLPVSGGWDRNRSIFIRQSQPLPLTVLSIISEVRTAER